MREHGSDFRRFLRGEWTRCRCGYDPHDNALLNAHFAEHGFREVDDHGTIRRFPVESVKESVKVYQPKNEISDRWYPR